MLWPTALESDRRVYDCCASGSADGGDASAAAVLGASSLNSVSDLLSVFNSTPAEAALSRCSLLTPREFPRQSAAQKSSCARSKPFEFAHQGTALARRVLHAEKI